MQSNSNPLTMILTVVGALCVVMAIFFAVANTSFLASSGGHHYKHAIAFAVAAVLCFVGANFTRRSHAA